MLERLQKLIANAGLGSRRAAEEMITAGEVMVNGEVVTVLGTKADPEKDHIKVRGRLINAKLANRTNAYILLNKPKGYLSSAADPDGRKLVVDLVKGHGRLFPIGRLDYNTEGLLILTNDGDFSNFVASSKQIPKVYDVKVKGLPPKAAINKLRRGVLLEDGFKTAPAEIDEKQSTDKNGWYEVTLNEGHNQQIRKMFDAIGHSVVKLKRIRIGSIEDPYLKVGESRSLTPEEVANIGTIKPKPVQRPKIIKQPAARPRSSAKPQFDRSRPTVAKRGEPRPEPSVSDRVKEVWPKSPRSADDRSRGARVPPSKPQDHRTRSARRSAEKPQEDRPWDPRAKFRKPLAGSSRDARRAAERSNDDSPDDFRRTSVRSEKAGGDPRGPSRSQNERGRGSRPASDRPRSERAGDAGPASGRPGEDRRPTARGRSERPQLDGRPSSSPRSERIDGDKPPVRRRAERPQEDRRPPSRSRSERPRSDRPQRSGDSKPRRGARPSGKGPGRP